MIARIKQQIQRLRAWLSEPQIEEQPWIEHHDPLTGNFRFKDQDAFRELFAPKEEDRESH